MMTSREIKPPVLLSGTEAKKLYHEKNELRKSHGGNDDEEVILCNGFKKYHRSNNKYMTESRNKNSKFLIPFDLRLRLGSLCYLSPVGVAMLDTNDTEVEPKLIPGFHVFEDAQSAFNFYHLVLKVGPETSDKENRCDLSSSSVELVNDDHDDNDDDDNDDNDSVDDNIKVKREYKRKRKTEKEPQSSQSNTKQILTDMTATVGAFGKQLKRLKSEHDRLENKKNTTIQTLEAHLKTADTKIASLERRLEKAEAAKNDLVTRNRALESQKSEADEFKNRWEVTKRMAAKMEIQNRSLEADFNKSESNNAILKNRIDVMETDKIAAQSKIKSLEEVVARFRQSAMALFSNIDG